MGLGTLSVCINHGIGWAMDVFTSYRQQFHCHTPAALRWVVIITCSDLYLKLATWYHLILSHQLHLLTYGHRDGQQPYCQYCLSGQLTFDTHYIDALDKGL